MIRLLLADDQALIRAGLRMILEAEDDVEVVGEAEDGALALTMARELRPDIVLMDIRMPKVDGIEATRRLLQGSDVTTKVLVLTTFDHDDYVYAALRAGASGFLLKTAPPKLLLDAVRVVATGEAIVAPTVTRRLIEGQVARARHDPPEELGTLTDREHQVLLLVAGGLSNAEVARELYVGEATVKTHVNRVLTKLGLRDRVQAVVFAYENGLIAPGH